MTSEQEKFLTKTLLVWYKKNKRDLPWRRTCDPYPIWISEMLLQQTRVESATSYYTRFIDRFPSVQHLADASLDSVLQVWQGLNMPGRTSRTKGLQDLVKTLENIALVETDKGGKSLFVQHVYSHFREHLFIYPCKGQSIGNRSKEKERKQTFRWLHPNHISQYPITGATRKILAKLNF